jgi:hypothetical protein
VRAQGLRVPQEVAFIGFDNARWAAQAVPPFTIIDQPADDAGLMAAEMLLHRLQRAHEERAVKCCQPGSSSVAHSETDRTGKRRWHPTEELWSCMSALQTCILNSSSIYEQGGVTCQRNRDGRGESSYAWRQ